MIIVSDTSPITNLAAIGRLDLLQTLYGHIIIPSEVYGEMVGLSKSVPGSREIQTFDWIKTQKVLNRQKIVELRNARENIDLGEAAAIALALETKADLLLIDERRGRVIASEYGLNIVGLLGVLLQAKARKMILTVKPLVDQLIAEANFRVSQKLYESVLKAANEST